MTYGADKPNIKRQPNFSNCLNTIRAGINRSLLVAILATIEVLLPKNSYGQEKAQFLNVEIKGKLSEQVQSILNWVIEPPPIFGREEIAAIISRESKSPFNFQPGVLFTPDAGFSGPGLGGGGRSFDAYSPFKFQYGPVNTKFNWKWPAYPFEFPNYRGFEAISVLKDDVEQFGNTKRQFKISPNATQQDIAHLIEIVQNSATRIELSNTPANEFQIEGSDTALTFQASSESCAVNTPNWPFDVDKVGTTISRALAILGSMGITHIRRSNVLVIDSGLGEGLAQSAPFKNFLYIDPSELLYSDTYYLNTSFDENSKQCLDVDRNLRTSDAYGYAPDESQIGCKTHTPLGRVAPIPKLEGARLPVYLPEHGSFVAGLAMGGPDLILKTKELDRLVGVTIARVTKMPITLTQSVKTEIADLRAALSFAQNRGVDIVNASFRVNDRDARGDLVHELEKFEGIVVAAAGNHPEELADDSGTFPATVTGKLRRNEQLIVVGAIQSNDAAPWWPSSAYSQTMVDIAAPGVNIVSYNTVGENVCMSGTSAAAPLVTFTAAVLRAVGVSRVSEIRRRILATASFHPELEGKVAEGRVLDIAVALDVFFDQIWLAGDSSPKRVQLQHASSDNSRPLMIQLCEPHSGYLSRSSGYIDPAALVYWRRTKAEKAEVWHRISDDISAVGQTCDIPKAEVAYWDAETGEKHVVPLSLVTRIVPTPFRNALPVARRLARYDRI